MSPDDGEQMVGHAKEIMSDDTCCATPDGCERKLMTGIRNKEGQIDARQLIIDEERGDDGGKDNRRRDRDKTPNNLYSDPEFALC